MRRVGGLLIGIAGSALITVGVLFLIRQFGPAARVAGLQPAKSWNPIDEAAA